jgi:hypothetical protein
MIKAQPELWRILFLGANFAAIVGICGYVSDRKIAVQRVVLFAQSIPRK